jgi:pentapeptide MXKDX repeat protein
MRKLWQLVAVGVVGVSLGVAVVGSGLSPSPSKDKMAGDKMMGDDKMSGEKMGSDKMGASKKLEGDKMRGDKMMEGDKGGK